MTAAHNQLPWSRHDAMHGWATTPTARDATLHTHVALIQTVLFIFFIWRIHQKGPLKFVIWPRFNDSGHYMFRQILMACKKTLHTQKDSGCCYVALLWNVIVIILRSKWDQSTKSLMFTRARPGQLVRGAGGRRQEMRGGMQLCPCSHKDTALALQHPGWLGGDIQDQGRRQPGNNHSGHHNFLTASYKYKSGIGKWNETGPVTVDQQHFVVGFGRVWHKINPEQILMIKYLNVQYLNLNQEYWLFLITYSFLCEQWCS